MVATDGEGLSGPPFTHLINFNRACSVWRNQDNAVAEILHIPEDLPDYRRLGLCTSIEIDRLEISGTTDITSLEFMGNVTVSITMYGINVHVCGSCFLRVEPRQQTGSKFIIIVNIVNFAYLSYNENSQLLNLIVKVLSEAAIKYKNTEWCKKY